MKTMTNTSHQPLHAPYEQSVLRQAQKILAEPSHVLSTISYPPGGDSV